MESIRRTSNLVRFVPQNGSISIQEYLRNCDCEKGRSETIYNIETLTAPGNDHVQRVDVVTMMNYETGRVDRRPQGDGTLGHITLATITRDMLRQSQLHG